MLRNKIVAKKIRNIVILLMTIIIMLGAYSNIRKSKAENVIPILMEVTDKTGALSALTLETEARESTGGIYLLDLPTSVNGNFVTKYYTVEGEEIPIEINGETVTLQLTEEEITNQKVQLETDYDKKEVTIGEETITLYNKELKYYPEIEGEQEAGEETEGEETTQNTTTENETEQKIAEGSDDVIVTGYMPLEAKLEFSEIDLATLTAVKLPNEKETMKKAYEISVFEEVEVVETVETVNNAENTGTETTGETENTEGKGTATQTTGETKGTGTQTTGETENTAGAEAPQTEQVTKIEKVQYDPSIYNEELQVNIKYPKNTEIEEIVTIYNLTEDNKETEEVEETQVTKIESTLENENIKFASGNTLTKYIVAVEEVVTEEPEVNGEIDVNNGLDNSGLIEPEDPTQVTATTLPSTDYTTPYLPTGYTQLQGTDLSTGLVIQDSKGNQYVWVEVPRTTTVYPTTGLNITAFTDAEYTKIENDLHTYTTTYRNGTTYTDTWSSQEATGLTQYEYNTQKKKMLKSIYKNGGFYVGRYETGIDYSQGARTSSGNTTQIPVIKQNAYPYNFVTTNQAQALARSFASEGYEANLMFGVQWDLVLKYLEAKGTSQDVLNSDSTSFGNYMNNTYNITNTNAKYSTDSGSTWNSVTSSGYTTLAEERVFLTTGATSAFSKQNISDFAGNIGEWTLEYSSNSSTPQVVRGGSCGNYAYQWPASMRFGGAPLGRASETTSFRVALFKDEGTGQLSEAKEPTYIPEGYTHVAGTTMENGYVVKDGSGNEYVWVEVPQTTEVYPTAGLNITLFTNAEFTKIENDLHQYTTVYRAEGYVDEYHAYENTGLTESEYSTQKKKMLKSIYKNGGFYVGRYETGIDYSQGARTSAGNTTQTPVIKQNAYPYYYVTNVQAQSLASEMEKSEKYTSSLMFGVQWDLILKYLENKGATQSELITSSTAWGNTYNNTYNITNSNVKYSVDSGATWNSAPYNKTSTSEISLLTTGASSTFSKQNIYDIAGNMVEWTLEKSSDTTYPCVGRGNWYGTSGADTGASYRTNRGEANRSDSILGFRTALYKTEDLIVDVVKPAWTVKDVNIDKTNKKVTLKLQATDKYFENSTLTAENVVENLKVYIDEQEITSAEKLTKTLSEPTPLTETRDGKTVQYGVEYTLTLENWEETAIAFKASGRKYPEYSGLTKIKIAGGTITDLYGNSSQEQEVEIGLVDIIKPKIRYQDSKQDVDYSTNTVKVVFTVVDKYYSNTNLKVEDLTILIDGEEPDWTKVTREFTSVLGIKETVNGASKEVGKEYTLVLSNIEQIENNSDYSSILTVAIPSGKVADTSGNTNDAKTITVAIDVFAKGEESYPYIPEGYKRPAGTDLDTGLVIEDASGNQYVWVEVPRTTEVYPTAGLNITSFTDEDYDKIEADLHTYTTVYRNGTTYTDIWSSQEATGVTESEYNTQKKKMLKSVYLNGGFYVGRYETGIDYGQGARTSGGTTTQTPVIKQNAYPYTYVTKAQAQTLAESFASGGYETNLMFGVQWDLVLKYLETKGATQEELNTDSTNWGNYRNTLYNITNASAKYSLTGSGSEWNSAPYNKTAYGELVLSTGASDIFCKQNIYDLAGNVWEWTLEYTPDSANPYVFRGSYYGYHGSDFPASTRDPDTPNISMFHIGFRVALYRDEGTGAISEEKKPTYIPEGYRHVPGTTMDNGYVVEDTSGNQYVWIEVPQTTDVYKTAGLNITTFTDAEYTKIETDLHTYTNTYNVDTLSDNWLSEEAMGITQSQYNAQKKKMLKSIYKNGGFYIGRYETGIDYSQSARTEEGTATTQTPVIKQNAYPYSYVTTAQAQKLSVDFATGGYTSSLMFSVQWNLVMKYLETKGATQAELITDSTNWGNYKNTTYSIINTNAKYSSTDNKRSTWSSAPYTKTAEAVGLLSTGSSGKFSKQNIYDLAGNVAERILATDGTNLGSRGGQDYYTGTGKPVAGGENSITSASLSHPNHGFRVALYKDEGIVADSYATEPTYIPEGYTHVPGTTMDNGYVVKDGSGNEYVWVEVPRTTTVYPTAGINITEFTGNELDVIEADLHTYTDIYRNGTTYTDIWSSQEATGLTQSEYNELKKSMLKSIYKHEGFYVGRYETGIDYSQSARTASGTTTQTPVIKQNAYPYNYVTINQSQQLSKSFAQEGYTSSLMYGVQWDLVLKYMETKGATQSELNSDSTAWGNYKNTLYNITDTNVKYCTNVWNNAPYNKTDTSANVYLTTGASELFKKQNIYDIAGNVFEATLEYSNIADGPGVTRGASADAVEPKSCVSYRGTGDAVDHGGMNNGFRVALYKTEDIVDAVDPVWTAKDINIDKANNEVTLKLQATDQYFKNTTIMPENITEKIKIYIDGEEITSVENVKPILSVATPLTETRTVNGTQKQVQYGEEYTLTIKNWGETLEKYIESGRTYEEYSGLTKIKIAKGTIKDLYGNSSQEQELEIGQVDFLKPEITYKYSQADINKTNKTVKVVFTVTDKGYATTNTNLAVQDLTILVDGEEPDWTKVTREFTSVTDITATIGRTSKVVGKRYTLLLSNLEQDEIAEGDNYLNYSGVVTIGIPAGKVADVSNNTNNAKTITIGIDSSAEGGEIYPYIPEGYTQVDGTDLNTGLVVQDGFGNEYVWVEVPQTTDVYKTAGLNITSFTDAEYTKIENDLHTYTTTYRNGTTYTDTWSSQEATGLTQYEYNTQKKKMLKSVYMNGGFYVGRYETGIEDSYRTASGNATEIPVIKQNVYPYNFVTSAQAQTLARSFASEGYEANLMFGVQWDLIAKYLETKGVKQEELNTDSTSLGNYKNNAYNITNTNAKYNIYSSGLTGWYMAPYRKTSTTQATILTTGASDAFSMQNIYDFAGNMWERTLENAGDVNNPISYRGGSGHWNGNDRVITYRAPENTTSIHYDHGFRVALYKDEGTGAVSETKEPTYIPEGYTHVAGTTMENGYVVKDGSGNEYVWVEVPQTAEVYPTAGLNITSFTDAEYDKIEADLHTYTSTYRNGTTAVDEYYSDEVTGLTSNEYNMLKKNMLKSIYKHGGFYVGRYETGIDYSQGARTTAGEATQTPVIKQNAYPYNVVTNSQAQELSESFASEGYTSSLMFGVQWDLIMKYLEVKGATQAELNTDSTAWGNYASSLWTVTNVNSKYSTDGCKSWVTGAYGEKNEVQGVFLSTGAIDTFSKQNIYDLAGNIHEKTLEYSSVTDYPNMLRGSAPHLRND